jgi:hypothetical protein
VFAVTVTFRTELDRNTALPPTQSKTLDTNTNPVAFSTWMAQYWSRRLVRCLWTELTTLEMAPLTGYNTLTAPERCVA